MKIILIITGVVFLVWWAFISFNDIKDSNTEPDTDTEPEPAPAPPVVIQDPQTQPPPLQITPPPVLIQAPQPSQIDFTPKPDPEREKLEKIAANLLLYSGVKNKNVWHEVHEMSTDQLKIIIADYYINKDE
jgi:hypothetical protein